tara:strand:+ start:8945 stop:10519 length:1575 start_codon:yes stop_codon:yes gene_type:complete
MSNIIIYQSEKEAGLEQQIRSNASIAYASPLCPADKIKSTVLDSFKSNASEFLSVAGTEDDDVYHTYSILVTSSWNRNDDVFGAEEVWAARKTPQYKPANLEHDEKKIIGSIISSWPVDNEFNLIDDNSTAEDLPDKMHILVSSVIYRQWQDPEYKARAEELIRKIEHGDMFVSMECIFRGFDYAVQSPDGDNHIVARNEETSFLTRHLRSYGGTGEYQGHQVGRMLRNITFSGKGFVEKPANPESVIFDNDEIFDFAGASVSKNLFSKNNGVSVRVEQNILSNAGSEEEILMTSDFLNEQVKELKEALATSQAEVKELSEKVSKANVEKLEAEAVELNQTVESLSETVAQAEELAKADAEKIEALEATIAELTEAKDTAEAAIAEMEEKEKRNARAAALIEAGIAADQVEAKLETFASLTDEQFSEVVATIASIQPEVVEVEETEAAEGDDEAEEAETPAEDAEEEAEAEAEAEELAEEVLETASVEEEADLSVASEEEEVDESGQTRASLQNWVDSYVFNNE